MSMIFGLVLLFLLPVALLFHWVVYKFPCMKLFDVVYLFLSQTFFENSCANLFQSDFSSIGKFENHF